MNRLRSTRGLCQALTAATPFLALACGHHARLDVLPTREATKNDAEPNVELRQRPFSLIEAMADGALKSRLTSCKAQPLRRSRFSVAHRGAPLHYPEHTRESYIAAARMGAGLIECDVTFTKDRELVCRHSQCDLHSTTNILETPLAARCRVPFSPADPKEPARKATALCCASDLTLKEFKSLCGRMGDTDPDASSVGEYLKPPPKDQHYPISACPTLLSHAESIRLLNELGVDFIPELKKAFVARDEEVYPRRGFALRLLEEYEQAQIAPERVYPQSFYLSDIQIWMKEKPEFAAQAIFLDARFDEVAFNRNDPATFSPTMSELKKLGIRFLGPPLWGLLREADGNLAPSDYAIEAKQAGLELIPWGLERKWSYKGKAPGPEESLLRLLQGDESFYPLVDVLARKIGVSAVFSDWPANVSYYANCVGTADNSLD